MKTILYNPIFINPQAYYVFPQLYNIQKGDSFIEPAVYSGYLLIEDLISNTSSQVINTREVDFTEFAGKRIRISQYTNLGAVVLGEWLLPEGEPSGPSFHQSLVDAWFMSGLSNNDKPSSIRGVKGNDLALKNFAYSLSSGFGKYEVDWSTYRKNNIDILQSGLIHKPQGSNGSIATPFISLTSNIPSYSIKVEGLSYGSIDYYYRNSEGNQAIFNIKQSGIHKLPICYKDGTSGTNVIINILSTDAVTITQLPSAYEGALVFDGVDDYGICVGLPILDDYTVICRRVIEGNRSANVVASKSVTTGKGAFIFEIFDTKNSTWSFGVQNDVDINYNDSVSWQTKKSYNGEKNLVVGSGSDTDTLCLGILREKDSRCLKGAIYYFALYDKSLTPEEIEEEKVKLESEWEGGKNELA